MKWAFMILLLIYCLFLDWELWEVRCRLDGGKLTSFKEGCVKP